MKEPPPEDELLIRRIAEGDRRAVGVLYDRYGRLVYSIALQLTRDRSCAEEIAQDVFTTVWRKAGRFEPQKAALVTWMVRITRNRAIDELRKRKSRKDVTVGNVLEVVEEVDNTDFQNSRVIDPEASAIREWDRSRVVRAVHSLPEDQRVALLLAYFRDLTQKEIAETLGEPLGTIKSRIRIGLHKLRKLLEAPEVPE